ncbi:MAG TPA: DUF3108 domain-containing protein [Terriglobales bacterium]|nr:DUF3108 domain-containing protein [Terriglobales bacterium]
MTIATARCFVVLTILLSCELLGDAAAPGQSSHPAAAQSEARIGSASHIQPLRTGFQFPYGQTLHYEGEWRFWTAGVATVRIEQSGSQNHIAATADSTGVVSLLYRVQDRFNSYFDGKSLCSSKLIKHTEEGSHKRETTITYEYARGKAVLDERNLKDNQQKRVENDIPNCVTDVLSGIFYVSSLPLQIGATYTFPLNDGSKTVTVQAHVEGKEQIKTTAGTFQTLRVGPEGDSGALLKNKGRIWIWYTDDDKHLPVQMRAKLFWGTVTVYLTSITK